jgi:hypothetical protein
MLLFSGKRGPGLTVAQPGGPRDRFSVFFPFVPEDGGRIQFLEHCSFITVYLDDGQSPEK